MVAISNLLRQKEAVAGPFQTLYARQYLFVNDNFYTLKGSIPSASSTSSEKRKIFVALDVRSVEFGMWSMHAEH